MNTKTIMNAKALAILADLVESERTQPLPMITMVSMKGTLMTLLNLSDEGLIKNASPSGTYWGIVATQKGKEFIENHPNLIPQNYKGTIARINS